VKRSVAPVLIEATAILQLAATETALANGPDSELDERVVTARRRKETLSEVPVRSGLQGLTHELFTGLDGASGA
jgi:hypothetical protein